MTIAFAVLAVGVAAFCPVSSSSDPGDADRSELGQRVAAQIEALHRRLAKGLVWEEVVAGGWQAAARAQLPPWCLTLWANQPSETRVASLTVILGTSTGNPVADLRARLALDGQVWELVAARYHCGKHTPGPQANVTNILQWLHRQKPSISVANLNIIPNATRQAPRKLFGVSHSGSSMLCALGICLAWKDGEPVWIGPDMSNEEWPGFSVGAIALAVDLHQEMIGKRDRAFFRQSNFDVALPVLVRRARKVRVDSESGLVIVEAEKTKLWLSPQYGYQPVRREWYCLLEDHLLAVDEFSDYREIGDGVWLPFRWHRTYERDAYRGEVSDAVVVVRRAELRAPDEAELRELFLNAVPEDRTIVVDFRWIRNPFTGRPRHVTYPFRRDPAELAALREQAVARARAQMAWILRVGPGAGGNAAVPLVVAALLLAVAGFFVWVAWRRRRRKQDA